MRFSKMRSSPFAFACLLAGSPAALGTTLRVPEDHASIQAALDAGGDGDTVLVAPGNYEVRAPLLFHGRAITLQSAAGAALTTIRMGQPLNPSRESIISFESAEPREAAVEGFTLTGGKGIQLIIEPQEFEGAFLARVGGAVYIGPHAAARVSKNVFRENEAEYGGAVFCNVESEPLILANEFTENSTVGSPQVMTHRGGAIAAVEDSVVTIGGGTFLRNRSYDGAAVYGASGCQIEILGSRFEENVAEDDGGAILSNGFGLRVFSSTFLRNRSKDTGGAVSVHDQTFTRPFLLTIEDCEFRENESDNGGGMFLEISKQFPPAPPNAAKVAFCRFQGNRAMRTGGGFSNGYESDVIVVDTCVFEDNTASRGGGAYLDYESLNDLRNCTFLRNQALAGGGVLGEEDNRSTLTNCTFLGNAARWSGGGVAFRFGSLGRQITHCTIVGNAAGNGPGGLDLLPEQGFGLFAIESSIIWGNSGSSPMPPGDYTFSCVQGAAPLPGVGNINSSPQFAGWPGPEEMYVDPTAPAGGDGTQARPFQDLRAAVSGYQLALLPGSPCVGAGKGGTTMGAIAVGPPPAPGSTSRTLHLAAGTYSLEGVSLANGVSVLGAGPRETTLLGPAIGLSTGALLDSVRVIGGAPGAISIALGESPRLSNTIAMGGSPELDDYFVYQITEGFTGGFGVYCAKSSSPALDHCTIAGNWAAKLPEATTDCQSPSSSASGVFAREASPVIQSSIIAINAGGSIIGNATVRHSLVEGAAPWPGEGNLTGDPAFAGWPMLDSYVDASAPEGGDGSAARPFSTMASAIAEFDFALTQGSPCRGAGADGTDMGAGTGASQRPPAPSRTIHVAAGTYTVPDTSFALGLSLEGAGRDETLLLGTIGGLRTGASLSGVTIEGGGLEGAVMVGACESPEIRSIRARRSLRGLSVMGGSPTIADCIFTNCAVGILATPGSRPEIVRAHFVSNSSGVESRGGTLKLVNCVFEANSVGLSTYEGGSANLLQCTFHAHPGTSVQCPLPSSDVLLTNCILWQDGAGLAPMCGGLKNCLTLRDPLFVRLPVLNFSQYEILNSRGLYYSVPNWIVQAGDYHLQPGSPAVDIGLVEGAPPDDFEGNQRPCGAAPDAGAYELANCEGELFRRGDVNADAKLDLTDAIRTLNYLFGGGEEPGCLATADVSDSDGLNVADPIVLLGYLFLGTTQPAPPFPDCGLDPTPGDFTCATYPVCGG